VRKMPNLLIKPGEPDDNNRTINVTPDNAGWT
jgi:hypothetical protein